MEQATDAIDVGEASGTGALWDAVCVAGAVALVAGVGMIYVPAAVILAGAILLAFGLWGARAHAHQGERTDRDDTEG